MFVGSVQKTASKMVNMTGQWEWSIAGERSNDVRPDSGVRTRHYFNTNFAEQHIYCCDPEKPQYLHTQCPTLRLRTESPPRPPVPRT